MYKAIVCKIVTSPHPNADKIQIGHAFGHQVIVGLDVKDGDLGVFFPTDGQLSEEFCKANDLVARYDENGAKIGGGFFDEKRRVRAQSFRGVKSDGFWVPESYITNAVNMFGEIKYAHIGYDPGVTFDTYAGVPICNKYITDATRKAAQSHAKAQKARRQVNMPEHVETEQLRYFIDQIRDGDVVTVTRKLHGTSGRYGNVMTITPVEIPLTPLDKFLNLFRAFKKSPVTLYPGEFQYQIGTRRTILAQNATGYYGSEQFRRDAVKTLEGNLFRGEVLYFEIVGYVDEHRLIMGEQDIKDKELQKRFGKKMRYTYGCEPGQHKIFVYRITQENLEDIPIELPWEQVQARCVQLGVQTVPELFREIVPSDAEDRGTTREADRKYMMNTLDQIINGESGQEAIPDPLDNRHIMEGVVVRVDSPRGTQFYKMKSWVFGVLEGYIKDNKDYVDAEEAA